MNTTATNDWHQDNQLYLMTAVDEVREELQRYKDSSGNVADNKSESLGYSVAKEESKESDENISDPAALDSLVSLFSLSPFERNIVLMCAGMNLDSTFDLLCASIQGDQHPFPTFSLALAALPGAHWSALAPDAPLRYWRLIEVSTNGLLTKSRLHINERVLHYLTGISSRDERLSGIVKPLLSETNLVPSHSKLADNLFMAWSQKRGKSELPVVVLYGDDETGKQAIATSICEELEMNIETISAHDLPAASNELLELIRLLEREAALNGSVLFFDCSETDTTDSGRLNIITRFCEQIRGATIISSCKRNINLKRSTVAFEVKKPTSSEQQALWKSSLGAEADKLNGKLEMIASQFDLSARTIRHAGSEILNYLKTNGSESNDSSDVIWKMLWDECRESARPRLDDLAQRIKPFATFDDLVLPELQKQILNEVAIHIRQRAKVYGEWGFADKDARGLGISALFAGVSGTGKTMAAEVLANELSLDLYRIDLSQVVNKYIGETEKNLKKIFDAAEEGGAILLFDEADALFGKRSEVKDSHDRYANVEVSYLLQRMESYRGLAILTTNMKNAMDNAFLRRIRFVVQFSFPDATQRAEIWRRVFPSGVPTEHLDVKKLGRLNVAGGNIRNIALNAAFHAAEEGTPVRMTHLLRAARSEYSKLEKPLSTSETGGWV
jgi:AAA+ superfamily predicted ATPase